MGDRTTGVTDTAAGAGVAEVRAREYGSPDPTMATTTTADPGSGGTTLAITAYPAKWPSVSFKIRVEAEVMLVTAGFGTTSLTVTRAQDGTTAVAHTTGVRVAQVVAEQYVIPISERVASYKGMVTTFRTVGLASANHKIFAIHNATGSSVLVALRRLTVQVDDTGALLTVAPVIEANRITVVPTSGTALTKVPFDTALSSNASVTVNGCTASDGGAGTTLTVTLANMAWRGFKVRNATNVGQFLFPDESMIPSLCDDDPIYLRPLEGICVNVVQAAVTTAHYLVNCMWEEFTLP